MRVLLICPWLPPENSSAALRLGSFAANLADEGDSVRVIARVPEVSGQLPIEAADRDILVHRFVDPMVATKSILRRHGVARPALGDPSTAWTSVRRGARLRSGVLGALERIGRTCLLIPDQSIYWAAAALKGLDLGPWSPDVIVASGPPMSSFVVGAWLARKHHVPWVADFRDPLSSSSYYPYGALRQRLDIIVEKHLVRSASELTTVSEPIADDLEALHSKRPSVVLNGYNPTDFEKLDSVGAPACPGLRIVHCGEIYPDKRDPTALFQAMRIVAETGTRVEAYFYGDTPNVLAASVSREGLSDRVHLLPRVKYAESLALQSGADILLLFMWNDPRERGVYTGKLFEYVGARRPILMLGYEQSVAADLVRQRSLGLVSNDPVEIAARIQAWAEEKGKFGCVAPNSGAGGEGLTRREQALKLRRRLLDIVEAKLPPTGQSQLTLGDGSAHGG